MCTRKIILIITLYYVAQKLLGTDKSIIYQTIEYKNQTTMVFTHQQLPIEIYLYQSTYQNNVTMR